MTSLVKRWQTRYFPNGVTPYLYKLLQIAMHFLNMRRFKQVRHLLAVVAELMKTVNQDTEMFRKLRDMWFMIKTMHWATILAISELKEVLLKSPKLAPKVEELTKVEDKVIEFGIPLPDGEDPELPIDLVATDAARVPIYTKLKTYERHLKRSKLPHVADLYRSVLICDINFYDANNGNPFCCGKHGCGSRHGH
ncbi:uncharacterized protein LOC134826971 [Culicoides brevitarsis]|uniref:uncharacterized protein LOC134826971 n=1 Tax=Culicoides brevitarsis TaxID=469753 RepID=UPI00307BB447